MRGDFILMRKRFIIFLLFLSVIGLSACNQENNNNANNNNNDVNLDDMLPDLNVEFEPPEKIEVGETLKLEAIVTYDDELVTDASEVNFEYWIEGHKDDSTTIDSTNNKDGSYTAEVTIDEDAVIQIYAHTTAEGLHTMPLRTVIVGDAESDDSHEHEHVEGFGMHFMDVEDAKSGEEVEMMVHLHMEDDPFEDADVRFEIWNKDTSDSKDWVDAEETTAGEYVVNYTFEEAGTYTIQIHVEDDDGLHEHEEHDVKVSE